MGLADKTMAALASTVSRRTIIDRYLPVVLAASIVGILAWSRVTPITVLDSEVTPPTAHKGDRIEVKRHLEWNRRDCWSYDASTTFFDSAVPSFAHTIEVKHYGLPSLADFTDHDWQIPYSMQWGKTKISTDLAFSCFPFFKAWPVRVELPDLTFEIVPP